MLDQQSRYDSYRDSGIPWLAEVPTEWDIQRAKWLFHKMERPVRAEDDVVTAFRDGQVTLRTNRRTEGFTNAIQEHGYQGIRVGDLVIHAMDAFAGAIGVSESNGKSSPVYAACVPRGLFDVAPRYFAYALRYVALSGYILSLAKGIRERSTDFRFKDFGEMQMPVPDLDTQNRIVSFLDEKTAEIDAAVEKKRRLIDLLNEQKAILINRAVTRGLNPDAPMKDSGVDWIGEIPAHWDVLRNAALFEQTKKSGTADLPILSVSIHHGVSREELSEEENLRSAIKIADRTSYVEVLPGYIAYNMMRAWQGGIGAVYTHGMVSPAYVVARSNGRMDAEYFERLYRTKLFIDQMDQFSKGITDFRKRLYWEEFKVLLTLVPAVDEQIEIAAFCGKIDDACKDAVSATEKEIAILNEFKQTLIANAVTGKIKI